MPVDFSSLVLGPCLATFARDVTVYPVASNGVVSYRARGIFSSNPVDVVMQDGAIFSDVKTTLGIKLSEFEIPIVVGDRIEIGAVMYWTGDIDNDGQGGASITLRSTQTPRELP